jgi:hypothetical protein
MLQFALKAIVHGGACNDQSIGSSDNERHGLPEAWLPGGGKQVGAIEYQQVVNKKRCLDIRPLSQPSEVGHIWRPVRSGIEVHCIGGNLQASITVKEPSQLLQRWCVAGRFYRRLGGVMKCAAALLRRGGQPCPNT